MLLKDKVAIVTGGTRGIGFAVVKKFLKEGSKVVLCGSREETVNNAIETLQKDYPKENIRGIWPNLMDLEDLKEEFKKVKEEFGKVDILVNNAGLSAKEPFAEYTEEMFQKGYGLKCYGCVQLFQGHTSHYD